MPPTDPGGTEFGDEVPYLAFLTGRQSIFRSLSVSIFDAIVVEDQLALTCLTAKAREPEARRTVEGRRAPVTA